MNTSLRQTSPLLEQYLNERSEVCHNKIGTVSLMCRQFALITSLCRKQIEGCLKTFVKRCNNGISMGHIRGKASVKAFSEGSARVTSVWIIVN